MKKIKFTLLLAVMFCFFPPAQPEGRAAVLLDRVVAVVNEEIITWSELRRVVLLEGKEFLKNVPEDRKESVMQEMEKDFLNSLIDMKLQLQEARKKGMGVSASEIDSAIADIRKKFNLSDEVFENSLQAEGLTMNEYKARIGEQILLSKAVNYEVRANVVVTDADIEKYYEANKEQFAGREQRRIRQIFFAVPKESSRIAEIDAKAGEVMKRIANGEDFEKLAGEFSEDQSRQYGGDLGYISRGSVLKEVEDAAFSLKTGEVSRPFWSSAGLHIIKLEDKIEPEGIDKVRDRIRESLSEKAFKSRYNEWKAGLKEKAYIEIKL